MVFNYVLQPLLKEIFYEHFLKFSWGIRVIWTSRILRLVFNNTIRVLPTTDWNIDVFTNVYVALNTSIFKPTVYCRAITYS